MWTDKVQLRGVAVAGLLVAACALSASPRSDHGASYKAVTPLTVSIDFIPFVYPNVVDRAVNKLVPVAIWTTNSYRATDIKPTSVKVCNAPMRMYRTIDLDRDGDQDLVVYVYTRELGIGTSATQVKLTGAMYSGLPVNGSDSVVVK